MEKEIVANIQNEIVFNGAIYQKPDLLLDVEGIINSKYYFSDPTAKFLYDCASIIYRKGQKFTEKNIAIFMSEDDERFQIYKGYGGYKTIQSSIDLADVDDFKLYFETLKKYALLREYEFKGFDTRKIREHKKFPMATANEIYHTIKGLVDRVHSEINGQAEIEFITDGMSNFVKGFIETPDMGSTTPFTSFNELFRGYRSGTMFALGMLSNAGKTRFLVKLAAYNSIIQNHKTMLLLNEMSSDEVKLALLTTVLNNPEFQELHGVKITKNEEELALGVYKDDNGEFIYRKRNSVENFIETMDEYDMRLQMSSREYRDVLIVSQWIEEFGMKNLAVIDVCDSYTDKELETHIMKNIRTGYKHFFYDTLKSDTDGMGEWASFKKTATLLSQLAKSKEIFLYSSIQLLDEIENISALNLNSNHIANAKQIRHVLTTLILAKEIEADEYGKIKYFPTGNNIYGESPKMALPLPEPNSPDDKLYSMIVSKNRAGKKKKVLFGVNLNTNVWLEYGYLARK